MAKQNTILEPTIEELEAMLAKKKKAEKDKLEAARKAYEDSREMLLVALCGKAIGLSRDIAEFKQTAFNSLLKFRKQMLAYGDLKGGKNNKGSFEVKNDRFKVIFASQILKKFDERAELGEAKLKEFLKTFVKKRDAEVFELVNALMQRNEKTGDFDVNLINRLYKMEDRFDDPNWREGIRLFKESYSPDGTAQYARFYKRNSVGQWELISLDFAKARFEVASEGEGIPQVRDASSASNKKGGGQ